MQGRNTKISAEMYVANSPSSLFLTHRNYASFLCWIM